MNSNLVNDFQHRNDFQQKSRSHSWYHPHFHFTLQFLSPVASTSITSLIFPASYYLPPLLLYYFRIWSFIGHVYYNCLLTCFFQSILHKRIFPKTQVKGNECLHILKWRLNLFCLILYSIMKSDLTHFVGEGKTVSSPREQRASNYDFEDTVHPALRKREANFLHANSLNYWTPVLMGHWGFSFDRKENNIIFRIIEIFFFVYCFVFFFSSE